MTVLPETGRWQPAGLTEGVLVLTQRRVRTRTPSTTASRRSPYPCRGGFGVPTQARHRCEGGDPASLCALANKRDPCLRGGDGKGKGAPW